MCLLHFSLRVVTFNLRLNRIRLLVSFSTQCSLGPWLSRWKETKSSGRLPRRLEAGRACSFLQWPFRTLDYYNTDFFLKKKKRRDLIRMKGNMRYEKEINGVIVRLVAQRDECEHRSSKFRRTTCRKLE